ncbi:rhamnulokinase [Carnobacterium pleistocenium]|uniref:rhamnulokinase n=1 Tax=Carnobacterium pleistocenium TaxID=181073 RepID=UPI00055350AE
MDYIAVDIGASSGRLIHANFQCLGGFELEEIHRFKNGFQDKEGTDYWNFNNLVNEILDGLVKVKKKGIKECYVGIDTWGVDYGLVNEKNYLLGDPISYRDNRTESVLQDFSLKMSLENLYKKTGIQLQPFNTAFQLFVEDKEKLGKADKLLLIPDLLGYIFTGKAVTEKTNASTMQLLNLKSHKWDKDVLEVVGVEKDIFPPLTEPGQILGEIQYDKFPKYDLPKVTFITVASHDTASAVVGTPGEGEEWAYISSGTWSLMGVEIPEGISTKEAFDSNFTNEAGVQGTIRFLKNIMGMWLIQEVARMQDYKYSYAELASMASKEKKFQQFINVNDVRFLNPRNMIEELQEYCYETNQKAPKTPGELARCIYDNLALCYEVELENLEKITGRNISKLHIVGGGSNNKLLNQLTADVCNIEVEAGPVEATAIGNLMVQIIATKGYGTLEQAREDIRNSVDLEIHQPQFSLEIEEAIKGYKNFINKKQLV